MKVYLIKVFIPSKLNEYKKINFALPQDIFSVAAATPDYIDLELCDEKIGMRPKVSLDSDVVGISFETHAANHAYDLAQKYMKLGKTVILTGDHPSRLPDEAKCYCHSVLIGEPEEVWEQLLLDVESNKLKSFYKRNTPFDLRKLRPYPIDLIPPSKYEYYWSVLVSRSCIFNCKYCAVHSCISKSHRVRPVDDIIKEIQGLPSNVRIEFHGDNLTTDREYAKSLFNALIPLKRKWVGEGAIWSVNDELRYLLAASGCQELRIGIEINSLISKKRFNSIEDIKSKIRNFHKVGIKVNSFIIFGFDFHTTSIFQEAFDFYKKIEIDNVESIVLTPFPGTSLFKRLKLDKRLLRADWSRYNGNDVVYRPMRMSDSELKRGVLWFRKNIKSIDRTSIRINKLLKFDTFKRSRIKLKISIVLSLLILIIVVKVY